ncbi:hypothetical protein IWZ03DRAFT_426000 [Phyllosticta citriasiana]|uniref:Uncharacterized protein n=1 Tax=Phyllosticta citriasiana TaxID=595635 RepID=A0ABR1KC91_9PEZI
MKQSSFFLNAVNGSFQEASNDVLDLPETDEQTFEIFADWMRFGKLPTFFTGPVPTRTRSEMTNQRQFINLYLFAHLYQIVSLEDRLKDEYRAAFFPKVQDSLDVFYAFPTYEDLNPILSELPK